MTVKDRINHTIVKTTNKIIGLAQEETDRSGVPKIITEGMPELLRLSAAEGAVLLRNEGVLPFEKGTKLSLFSRVCEDWFFVGYGSGGDVNYPYEISLADAVRNSEKLEINEELDEIYNKWRNENPIDHGFWGNWPFYYPDMPLDEAIVKAAAEKSDAAVITIGRSSGEDRDCCLEKGSYYLTDDEEKMIKLVTESFEKTVLLLNVGGIMDMEWLESFGNKIGAVMYVWQGGMESGNAVCDLLCGDVSPSGRLADTVARKYEDYPSANFGNKDFNEYTEDIYVGYRYFETFAPEKVLFPFGYGLSYSSFDIEPLGVTPEKDGFKVAVSVKNTGEVNAKQVVQLYLEKPNGKLGNPLRELAAYGKTKELAPGESEELELFVNAYQLSSYDDGSFAYIIESGEYKLHLGENVRKTQEIYSYYQEKDEVFVQLSQAAAPQESLEVYCSEAENGKRVLKKKKTPAQKYDLATRIINNLPKDIELTGDKGIKLIDVKEGRATMEEFVAQLSPDELEAITRGDYKMGSPLGAEGNAGAFAGVLQSLRDKGVPPVITTDGPSGIRLKASCSLLPIGTLLACSFNCELIKELYSAVSKEMVDRGSDVLLGPGINIHRNPLCGRNFEYFSEDPYLTGTAGAACVEGIQAEGVSACPKHFACNNQEFKRTVCDSRLSERALREIYLKAFEICIKLAEPKNIMTSYNKVNGVWSHYHYDLCTAILRKEWGYKGNVMTDWWMKSSKSPEFPNLRDQAYRVRAQVDLLMPGAKRINNGKPDGTLLKTYGKPDGIRLGEMQRSAMNVLRAAMEIKL